MDYYVRELKSRDLIAGSKIIGIRHTMEKSGSDYYLHIIYQRPNDRVLYLRVSPTNTSDGMA